MRWPFRKKKALANELCFAAVRNDAKRLQELLAAGASLEATNSDGWIPLHAAAMNGASAATKTLIDAGADIEAAQSDGWRALHWAAVHDASAAMKTLIEAGADVEAGVADGARVMHLAAYSDASAAVKTLIEVGSDVEAASFTGAKPLHFAARKDASAAVKTLIEAGANIDATDGYGFTPLHNAAEKNCMNSLLLLLRAGADIHAHVEDGRTPLQLAKENGHAAVVQVLEYAVHHHSAAQSVQESTEEPGENPSNVALSYKPISTPPPSIKEQPTIAATSSEKPHLEQVQAASDVQSEESARNTVATLPQPMPVSKGRDDSMTSDSDSSWTSEEATDQMRAVQDLKEDDIFAENYCLERKLIFGKPLVRLAKELHTNRDVILKFYDNVELYAKALSSFKLLNKSNYVCKPIEKIKARGGFPDCLAFERGIHTLDEWMRIPDIGPESKREALKLVAAALHDLHCLNIVHCDVKPANLAFFPADHKWKLLDIDSALEVGVSGEIITTISYASPEVLHAVEEDRTELAMHPSADMWAYGLIAFEVFTGERFYEFEPTIESVLEFLRSERFKMRVDDVKDRRQRHFIKKFLKWNASERHCAQEACTSTIFQSATITVSKPLVSHAGSRN